jgi:hypothetical protein
MMRQDALAAFFRAFFRAAIFSRARGLLRRLGELRAVLLLEHEWRLREELV